MKKCSRKKLELQPKEVDLTDLGKWLETEVQVKEMAFGCSQTEDSKQDGGKSRPYPNRSKWSKRQRDTPNNTFAASGVKQNVSFAKETMGSRCAELGRRQP